jgi:AcrR family transcriptional regulator
MARPATIADSDILQAAREVFLTRGIRATTSEVAQHAGVSEGTIFNRFKSKDRLFRAAMDLELHEPTWIVNLRDYVGRGDVRENLVAIGLAALEFFRATLPLTMMAWSNRCFEQKLAGAPSDCCSPQAMPILKRLSAFFEAEMRAGRMRRHDPEIVARTFIGSVVNYVYLEMVSGTTDELPLPPEMFMRGFINLLWAGAKAEHPAS